jgi:hypothetical protein
VVERKRLSRGRGGKEKVRLPGKIDCGEEIDAIETADSQPSLLRSNYWQTWDEGVCEALRR